MSIRKLDPETVDRIAAGEVVTRPARVVAELVDNSLDAGASQVDVAVDGDGTDRIRVADDGHGMTREDAPLAVERHATSKIRDHDDLRTTATLGFRGEALPSIAETGYLEIVTSDGSAVGTRVVNEQDGNVAVEDAGRARGTTVEVRDLFHNRPARRDALAGAGTEFGRISDLLTHYALVRPDVAFSLTHDDRETFSTPGSGDYRDAVLAIYDRKTATRSSSFSHETTVEARGEPQDVRVEGLLVYPSTTRADRSHVRIAVCSRPVADDGVRRAVERGYGTLLPDGRHPVAVVSVDVPPETVDANVHPAKAEVALTARDAVESAVEQGVEDALTTADLRRAGEVAMDLDSSLAPKETESALGDVDVVGQFRDLYVLCEADDELLVVDQHAAHERVNYERLRAALADEGVPAAPLDPPETVSLTPREAAVVEDAGDDLAALGFEATPFGGTTVKLSAVPAPLGRVADADAFRETVAALADGGASTTADARDDLLKDLACHPSLKAGDALADETAAALVERLGQCEQPFACPHGRPTVLSVDEETLIRGFERGARLQ